MRNFLWNITVRCQAIISQEAHFSINMRIFISRLTSLVLILYVFWARKCFCYRFGNILSRTGRRKEATKSNDVLQTRLKRCLSTLDITLLGIGHMMGSGIYVISPEVAKKAGPACVISYVIAGEHFSSHVGLFQFR